MPWPNWRFLYWEKKLCEYTDTQLPSSATPNLSENTLLSSFLNLICYSGSRNVTILKYSNATYCLKWKVPMRWRAQEWRLETNLGIILILHENGGPENPNDLPPVTSWVCLCPDHDLLTHTTTFFLLSPHCLSTLIIWTHNVHGVKQAAIIPGMTTEVLSF